MNLDEDKIWLIYNWQLATYNIFNTVKQIIQTFYYITWWSKILAINFIDLKLSIFDLKNDNLIQKDILSRQCQFLHF